MAMEPSATKAPALATGDTSPIFGSGEDDYDISEDNKALERRLRLKVDLRLCTIGSIYPK